MIDVLDNNDREKPFGVSSRDEEVWVLLRPRQGKLADIPDPQEQNVVWHRLTRSEAESLRDALTSALARS